MMARVTSVEIDGRRAGITFSAAHFLVDHDKCERIHGHNYVVSARVEGRLDKRGMVVDFTALKRALREIVASMDHHLLIPGAGALWPETAGEVVRFEHGGRQYTFPASDVVILGVTAVTAENLAGLVLDRLLEEIPTDSITRLSVGVEEVPGQSAWVSVDLPGGSAASHS